MDAISLYAYQNNLRGPPTATSRNSDSCSASSSAPIPLSAQTLRRDAPSMSSLTIASLKRIDRDALYNLLKQTPATSLSTAADSAPSSAPSSAVAIIDVRDSDFIGGHIRGCTNVPTSALDYKLPELVRQLKDTQTVVFHCALSQQRGPSAALRYLRERARLLGEAEGDVGGQDVRVLDGGFVKWQEKYGDDSTVTEGYKKDIWEYGY